MFFSLAFLGLGCGSEDLGGDSPGPGDPGPGDPPGDGEPSDVVSTALPERPRLTQLYAPVAPRSATALAFNPEVADELWVTLRQFPMDAPCTQDVPTGCAALPGEMVWVRDASTDAPSSVLKRDGNAWHFMRRPTSLAFGAAATLATCGEARTDNYDDDAIDYAGPVLWSSDPAIFGAIPTPEQNGTHIDMLHSTPFCMGIAHERDNVYWTFNGQIGALDRYDFKAPHVIGGEDHSDGELYRYAVGELSRVAEVPSHMLIDPETDELYVADTGNGRVVAVDVTSGTPGASVTQYDGMDVHVSMDGALLRELVPPGTLEAPSGVALHEGVLFVTDNATSRIHAFDADGMELGNLELDLPAGSLGGIALDADGVVYLADLANGRVYRVDSD